MKNSKEEVVEKLEKLKTDGEQAKQKIIEFVDYIVTTWNDGLETETNEKGEEVPIIPITREQYGDIHTPSGAKND